MIVSGTVFDNEMGVIPYANVEVVGENRFTTADADGRFSIVANSVSSLLKFSHAAYDFDTISVAEFNQFGYINLWPSTLLEVVIPPTSKPKQKDNSLLWLLGIGTLVAIAVGVSSSKSKKNQSVKVTA